MPDHSRSIARSPLFCSVELAARIERAEAKLIGDVAAAGHRRIADSRGFAISIGGGVATYVEAGSPFNKVAGLGFAGVPSGDEFNAVEAVFAERGEPTAFEVSHLGHPALFEALADRGYRLEAFENVLGRPIACEPVGWTPPGIAVRHSTDGDFEEWLGVMADGVAAPDVQGIAWHEEFPREIYMNALRDGEAAGVARYSAFHDGVLAGGGCLRVFDGVVHFAGAATAPAHRRKGIQTSLTAARLTDAADAGGDIGVVITQPGSKSAQNVQRSGFDLLYARAVLVKQP